MVTYIVVWTRTSKTVQYSVHKDCNPAHQFKLDSDLLTSCPYQVTTNISVTIVEVQSVVLGAVFQSIHLLPSVELTHPESVRVQVFPDFWHLLTQFPTHYILVVPILETLYQSRIVYPEISVVVE